MRLGPAGDAARDLAYRLYILCERKGMARESQAYNMLVTTWTALRDQAAQASAAQGQLW